MVPASNPRQRYEGGLLNNYPWEPVEHAYLYCASNDSSTVCHLTPNTEQTATALGKLGHPDGELNLTRAAAKHNVIQMVCLKNFSDDID